MNYSSRVLQLHGVLELRCLARKLCGAAGVKLQSHAKQALTSKMLEALIVSCALRIGLEIIDEKNKQPATFWSCLQDIQEGLQELISITYSRVGAVFLDAARNKSLDANKNKSTASHDYIDDLLLVTIDYRL
ncbi:hypothetical protein ACP4OV_031044 [Aristida adscensionis]